MKGKKYKKWLEKHQDRPCQMSMQKKEFDDKLRSAAEAGLDKDSINQRFREAIVDELLKRILEGEGTETPKGIFG